MTESSDSNNAGIIQSQEYKDKKNEIKSLKSELAKLISERDLLENTVKKNLEALYAAKIGINEFNLFKIECEIARLKRKIELFQQKINHGEKVDIADIDDQLNIEYEKWDKEMSVMLNNIKSSTIRLSHLANEEDSKQLQDLYRTLVKILHPDINPDQTEKSKLLWNRTMQAHSNGDIEELRAIKLLLADIDDVVVTDSGPNIDDRIVSVKKKIFAYLEFIKKIKSEFPFTIEQSINNDDWVADKNSKILKKIEKLNIRKEDLQMVVSRLLLQCIDVPDPKTIN